MLDCLTEYRRRQNWNILHLYEPRSDRRSFYVSSSDKRGLSPQKCSQSPQREISSLLIKKHRVIHYRISIIVWFRGGDISCAWKSQFENFQVRLFLPLYDIRLEWLALTDDTSNIYCRTDIEARTLTWSLTSPANEGWPTKIIANWSYSTRNTVTTSRFLLFLAIILEHKSQGQTLRYSSLLHQKGQSSPSSARSTARMARRQFLCSHSYVPVSQTECLDRAWNGISASFFVIRMVYQ